MTTQAPATRKENMQPRGLLDLPNELLIGIVSFLSVPDVRILGRSCRELLAFTRDYLDRYIYNTGIFVLPDKIISMIARHVPNGWLKDLIPFARATQRYYPLITRIIALKNIEVGENSLLHWAATRTLIPMARNILDLGGDINKKPPSTALCYAADRGHTKMVKFLLSRGASQIILGERKPLLRAIRKEHESTAIALSRDIDPYSTKVGRNGEVALHLACERKLVRLVRHYLGDRQVTDPSSQSLYDAALRIVVKRNLSGGDIIKRAILQRGYLIVLMLIHHGADPKAVSDIASRHRDPRVRTILASSVAQEKLEANWEVVVGREWSLGDDEDKDEDADTNISDTSPYVVRFEAGLLEYLKPTKKASVALLDDDIVLEQDSRDDEIVASPSAAADADSQKLHCPHMSETENPLDLSFYPPLAPTKASSQDKRKQFWADRPKTIESLPPKNEDDDKNLVTRASKKEKWKPLVV